MNHSATRRGTRRFDPFLWLFMCFMAGSIVACARVDHLRDSVSVNPDLTIHVVIENPAGSIEKWEVQTSGRLMQERTESGPVLIPYLPWPVNTGMMPRTLLSEELGGDGEPLDVLVLGPALDRGSLVRAIPIGLLRIVDRLERDDKILAVVPGTPLSEIDDIESLEMRFPGVQTILTTWYTHSRPGAALSVEGFGSRAAARRLIGECAKEFAEADRSESIPVWTSP